VRNLVLGFLASAALVGGAVAGIAALGGGGDGDAPARTTTVDASALPVPQYGMDSPAGNLAVHRMITDLRLRLSNGRIDTAAEVTSAVRTGVRRVARAGYVDVFNAEVREAIFDALYPSIEGAGIDPTAVPAKPKKKSK
jgi:hypothetical protein